MVSRLEPYLKAGLSIRNSCLESGVSRATLYRIMADDQDLRDQIDRFRNYLSILVTTSIARHLLGINAKQARGEELEGDDLRFLMWFAINSKHCREEFSREITATSGIDAHAEILRITQMIDRACEEESYV